MREATSQQKVSVIAHSQGSSIMLYALSMIKDQQYWKDRVNLFVAFNPVTNIGATKAAVLDFWAMYICNPFFWRFTMTFRPTMLNKGISRAHIAMRLWRNFHMRRWLPFYNTICRFWDQYLNPYQYWDKLRA